jgi:hypothetical protein
VGRQPGRSTVGARGFECQQSTGLLGARLWSQPLPAKLVQQQHHVREPGFSLDEILGLLSLNGTAPVWVGEFGTTNNNSDIENGAAGSQGQWFQSLVTFLQNNPALNWTYWALNGEDSYALLDSNYDSTPANPLKQQLLATIQSGPSGGGCTAVPAGPAGLKAKAESASQINLSWTAVTPGSGCSITYQLYSSTTANFTPSPSNRIATGLASTTYSNTGLTVAATYYYIATAVDSAGQSGDSNQASETTKTGAAPNPPSNLGATAISSSQINLGWTASSTLGVTYNVYSSKTSGFTPSSSNRIATGVTATTYSNSGPTASTTYYYLVTAVDSSGESQPSNQASATTESGGAAWRVTSPILSTPNGTSALQPALLSRTPVASPSTAGASPGHGPATRQSISPGIPTILRPGPTPHSRTPVGTPPLPRAQPSPVSASTPAIAEPTPALQRFA